MRKSDIWWCHLVASVEQHYRLTCCQYLNSPAFIDPLLRLNLRDLESVRLGAYDLKVWDQILKYNRESGGVRCFHGDKLRVAAGLFTGGSATFKKKSVNLFSFHLFIFHCKRYKDFQHAWVWHLCSGKFFLEILLWFCFCFYEAAEQLSLIRA